MNRTIPSAAERRADGRTLHQGEDHLFSKRVLLPSAIDLATSFLHLRRREAGRLPELAARRPSGWSDNTGLEYDFRLVVLPEHSYNLRVFAARYEPLFKEQAATQHSNIANSRGAVFRYRKKPYFAHVGYTDDSIESGNTTSDVQALSTTPSTSSVMRPGRRSRHRCHQPLVVQ